MPTCMCSHAVVWSMDLVSTCVLCWKVLESTGVIDPHYINLLYTNLFEWIYPDYKAQDMFVFLCTFTLGFTDHVCFAVVFGALCFSLLSDVLHVYSNTCTPAVSNTTHDLLLPAAGASLLQAQWVCFQWCSPAIQCNQESLPGQTAM